MPWIKASTLTITFEPNWWLHIWDVVVEITFPKLKLLTSGQSMFNIQVLLFPVERFQPGKHRNHSDLPEGDHDRFRNTERVNMTTSRYYHGNVSYPWTDSQSFIFRYSSAACLTTTSYFQSKSHHTGRFYLKCISFAMCVILFITPSLKLCLDNLILYVTAFLIG